MIKFKDFFRGAGMISMAALLATPVAAWEPTEEVEMVIHASPTSSTNFFVRQVASQFDTMLPSGAQAVNMPGAGGDKARRYVLNAEGNPHIIKGLTPSNINNPILRGADYGVQDFTPLATLVVAPIMVCVNAASDYKTLDDLIAAAREKPGTIIQGGGDVGEVDSLHHVLLSELAEVDMIFTPFESKGVIELLGGHIDFIMVNPSQCNPYVDSGDFRVLATSVTMEAHPDAPTFEETNYPIQILEQYRGFWMPSGVGQEVQDYYIEKLVEVSESDAFHEFANENGLMIRVVAGDELEAQLKQEEVLYRELSKKLGLLSN